MLPPFVHGIDLVDLSEFEQALERGGQRFLNRLFTSGELAYCTPLNKHVSSFAARFAAKEAVAKALGTGIGAHASFLEIEITRDHGTGAPGILLHGKAAKTAANQNITGWILSLSHTDTTALASVIGWKEQNASL